MMGAKGSSVIVVGAGIFGMTSALELARRGYRVTLVDQGPGPNPRAASSDNSKLMRLDSGSDGFLTALIEEALEGWSRWNREWGRPVFHQIGTLVLSTRPLSQGSFEHDSLTLLRQRGISVARFDRDTLGTRFPAWNADHIAEGYFYSQAGWIESARTIRRLQVEARTAGVRVRTGWAVTSLIEKGSRVIGVTGRDGQTLRSAWVVLATGSWTPAFLPELAECMWPTGYPVLYLRPARPERLRPPAFPTWAVDLDDAGWCGLPANREGLVKVVNMVQGRRLHPDDPRSPDPRCEADFRGFFSRVLPTLANAHLVGSHFQLDCETFDRGFWIGRHVDRDGLVVGAGGSGQGFKFAPLLGEAVADALEGQPNQFAERFGWRERPAHTGPQN